MEKKELKCIIVTENLRQSIVADVITFSILVGVLFINHIYLGSSWMVELFILLSLITVGHQRGSAKIKEMTPKQAHEYLAKYLGSKGNE